MKITPLKILDYIVGVVAIILAFVFDIHQMSFRIMIGVCGIIIFFKHDKIARIFCIGGIILLILYIHSQTMMSEMEYMMRR